MPDRFLAIGEWYEDFAQTSDEEVVALLRAAQAGPGAPAAGTAGGPGTAGVSGGEGVPAGAGALAWRLAAGVVPVDAAGQADDGQEEQVRERQADGTQEQVPDQARPVRRSPGPGRRRPGQGQASAAASSTASWP